VRRFVFASTCSVYGASDELLDERSETRPLSLYGRTKVASERVLLQLANPQFAPIILRFATIYGLSGRTRFDLVVNLLTARARLDGEITIHGGNQWRPFVHVEDAARGIVAVLTAPLESVGNQTFNIGGDDQNYTITQVGELVHDRVPEAKIVVDSANGDPRNYRVSFRKARQQLGFLPRWTVDDGIQQVLEAIASGQVVDYDDPRYSNAKYLSAEGTSKLAQHQWARQMLQELHD
jgi:nucleoside-diphosphate-sugar epimerase